RERVGKRAQLGVGGNDVVHRRECAGWKAHGEPHVVQHREGLGARDFMDQVQPDEELGLAVREFAHGVRVPDLVEKGPTEGCADSRGHGAHFRFEIERCSTGRRRSASRSILEPWSYSTPYTFPQAK